MDQKGANIVIYPAFIVLALGYLMLGQTTSGFMLLLSGVLLGFGYGNFQSITQALCIKVADAKNVGLATSTYFIALDFGSLNEMKFQVDASYLLLFYIRSPQSA